MHYNVVFTLDHSTLLHCIRVYAESENEAQSLAYQEQPDIGFIVSISPTGYKYL